MKLQGLEGYDLGYCVAEGGMGFVYDLDRIDSRVDHVLSDRLVAKFVRDDFWAKVEATIGISLNAQSPDSFPEITAFRRGVRSKMSQVSNKFHTDRCAAIVMEFVSGRNLREHINYVHPSIDKSLDIGMKILKALHLMHESGIVYRDLKLENVMVTGAGGDIKLIDFGLAHYNASTVVESTCGTVEYNSPEMWERPSSVDKRHDLYSFGVVLYELLNEGRSPFMIDPHSNRVVECRRVHLRENPEPCSSRVPKKLAEIIGKLLQKDVKKRYQSAFTVAVDIAEYMVGQDESLRMKDPYYSLLGRFSGGVAF